MIEKFQVKGGKNGADKVARETGMSVVENIFDDFFLLEVPHIRKRYDKYFNIKF